MAHPAAGKAALCRSALIFKSMQCITAVHSSLQNSTLYYSAVKGSGLALEWPFCTIYQCSMFSWNTRRPSRLAVAFGHRVQLTWSPALRKALLYQLV